MRVGPRAPPLLPAYCEVREFEETACYALNAPEAHLGCLLWNVTVGDGNVHCGPSHKLLAVTVTSLLLQRRRASSASELKMGPCGHALGHLIRCTNF